MIFASGHATLWTDTVHMTADFCHIGPLQLPEHGRAVRLSAALLAHGSGGLENVKESRHGAGK